MVNDNIDVFIDFALKTFVDIKTLDWVSRNVLDNLKQYLKSFDWHSQKKQDEKIIHIIYENMNDFYHMVITIDHELIRISQNYIFVNGYNSS